MLPTPPSCCQLKLWPLKPIAQGPVFPGESNGCSPFAAGSRGQGRAWAIKVADKMIQPRIQERGGVHPALTK